MTKYDSLNKKEELKDKKQKCTVNTYLFEVEDFYPLVIIVRINIINKE